MAATVSSLKVTSLRRLCPVFCLKNGYFLVFLLVTICNFQRFSAAADEHDFTEDFFKKEYSLAKPYSGKFALVLSGAMKEASRELI